MPQRLLPVLRHGERRRGEEEQGTKLPEVATPRRRRCRCRQPRTYNVAITGVGGGGVLTVGHIIGMAAHIDGIGAQVLDITGLAQKGGAVVSHVRLARAPRDIAAQRIPAGATDLLLATDLVVAASPEALAADFGRSAAAPSSTRT